MSFAENLHYLRKRDKITQEELADRLGVSRQSVSKWETGEAYPETDKLIYICDVFNITLDELLRTDLTAGVSDAARSEREESVQPFSPQQFISHVNGFAAKIACGVFLIFLGIALCLIFTGFSEYNNAKGDLIVILGAVVLLLFIAAAVFLFITAGLSHDKFKKQYPQAESVYTENDVNAFDKKFRIFMACLVTGIIVLVAALIVLCALIDKEIFSVGNKDAAFEFVTAVFLFGLGGIVSGLTFLGIIRMKYYVNEYNKENAVQNTKRKKLQDAICPAIMLTATATFLLLGVIGNLWHPAWVVFPVGGIICGIVSAILNSGNSEK